MKATALIVMLMATALLVSAANSQDSGGAKNEAESTKKIKDLQKERLDVLSAMAESAGRLAQQARVSHEVAYESRQQLLQAQIEYAEDDAQRIQFYESYIEVFKQSEELAITRKEGARGTEIPILKARAGRLGAEIELERLKAKAAK
jgi:hypothetical protein